MSYHGCGIPGVQQVCRMIRLYPRMFKPGKVIKSFFDGKDTGTLAIRTSIPWSSAVYERLGVKKGPPSVKLSEMGIIFGSGRKDNVIDLGTYRAYIREHGIPRWICRTSFREQGNALTPEKFAEISLCRLLSGWLLDVSQEVAYQGCQQIHELRPSMTLKDVIFHVSQQIGAVMKCREQAENAAQLDFLYFATNQLPYDDQHRGKTLAQFLKRTKLAGLQVNLFQGMTERPEFFAGFSGELLGKASNIGLVPEIIRARNHQSTQMDLLTILDTMLYLAAREVFIDTNSESEKITVTYNLGNLGRGENLTRVSHLPQQTFQALIEQISALAGVSFDRAASISSSSFKLIFDLYNNAQAIFIGAFIKNRGHETINFQLNIQEKPAEEVAH